MYSAIYKYHLAWEKINELSLPKSSEFLKLAIQDGLPTIWYKHNPVTHIKYDKKVTIIMRPTGNNMDGLFPGEDYIDTLFIGNLVFHFFFKH